MSARYKNKQAGKKTKVETTASWSWIETIAKSHPKTHLSALLRAMFCVFFLRLFRKFSGATMPTAAFFVVFLRCPRLHACTVLKTNKHEKVAYTLSRRTWQLWPCPAACASRIS